MEPRMTYFDKFPEAINKMMELEKLVSSSSIDKHLQHLIKIRVSQINGCAFCVDMHTKQAKIGGEKELRLHHLVVWEESPLFSMKEKAALKWAEAVTKLSQGSVADAVFAEAREHFSEKELTELTVAIGMINMWNRFGAPFRSVPGSMDQAWGLDKAGL